MKRAKRDAGFSLMEVIVALGILSTAAISLSTLSQSSLRGVKQLESRYLARVLADNELTRTFIDRAPLRIGVDQGEAEQLGQSFGWRRTVTQSPQAGVFLIEVEVFDLQSETVLADASTLKGAGI